MCCSSPLAADAFDSAGRAMPDIGDAARLHMNRRSPLAGDAFEAFLRPTAASEGPPEEQRAIVARTF